MHGKFVVLLPLASFWVCLTNGMMHKEIYRIAKRNVRRIVQPTRLEESPLALRGLDASGEDPFAQQGHEDLAPIAKVNCISKDNQAWGNQLELLLQQPDLEINTKLFFRPLFFYALAQCDYETLQRLLDRKDFDPNLQDDLWGNTALHWLVLWAKAYPDSKYLELIDLFRRDSRIRVDVRNYEDKTVLDLASEGSVDERIWHLLERSLFW